MKKVKVSYVRLTFVTIIMVSLNLLTKSSGVKTQNMLNTMSQICSGTNSNMVVKFVFNMPYFYSILPFEGCTNSIHRLRVVGTALSDQTC
ncbi:hypothetical protein IGI04_032304 [Brassica rapa subsp. trilocularis]|nr:hypothetical protein IGI04_032304 [Brassica rapa subsp. trilocularis]